MTFNFCNDFKKKQQWQKYHFSKALSDGSNNVRRSMFDRSKPKIGCSSSITNRWTCSSSFDVRKSDVRFYSMDNLVKAFWVRCSILVHSKLKFWHLSSIINRWTCSSSFDVRKNGVRPISMNSSEAMYDIVYLM